MRREEAVWGVYTIEQYRINNLLKEIYPDLRMWRKANDLLPICFEKWNFTIGFAKKKRKIKVHYLQLHS